MSVGLSLPGEGGRASDVTAPGRVRHVMPAWELYLTCSMLVTVVLFLAWCGHELRVAAHKDTVTLQGTLELVTEVRKLKAEVATTRARLDELLIELRRR